MRPTTLTQRVFAVAAVLATAACSAAAVRDKTGARTIVLHFATIDSLNPNGQSVAPTAFLEALTARSHDRLKVVVQQHYGNGAADAESQLVRAIGTGTVGGPAGSSRSTWRPAAGSGR
jgi:hypothetical protein